MGRSPRPPLARLAKRRDEGENPMAALGLQALARRGILSAPQPVPMEADMTEFDSVDAAIAAHDGPAYQEALKALDGGVERDLRIVEGLG